MFMGIKSKKSLDVFAIGERKDGARQG